MNPPSEIGVERRLRATYPRRELGSASEGGFRFLGGEAFAPHDGLAVVWSAVSAADWPRRSPRLSRGRAAARLVREFDRLAEMRDRLGEGGAAQSLVAGLAPPFDREVGLAGLREMMRERLGLRRGRGQQHLGGAPVQRLAAALQQAVVGGVLDQRVLEAIVGVGRDAFDEQQFRVREFFERGVAAPARRRPATAFSSA